MSCQKIEKLILEALEDIKNLEEIHIIQKHLKSCKNCTQFYFQLQKIKKILPQISSPTPSNNCLQNTRQLCLSLLNKKNELMLPSERMLTIKKTTPKFVWIILSLLILFTVSWFLFVLTGDGKEVTHINKKLWLITIALQNIFMLFFLPLLLKYFKKQTLERLL
jgi:predicted anti-sigma-YlaC factor YlaD